MRTFRAKKRAELISEIYDLQNWEQKRGEENISFGGILHSTIFFRLFLLFAHYA
jgi:hypothetical protein